MLAAPIVPTVLVGPANVTAPPLEIEVTLMVPPAPVLTFKTWLPPVTAPSPIVPAPVSVK